MELPCVAGASADALGGKMVMDRASNIERGSKMIIALEGQTHAVRLADEWLEIAFQICEWTKR